MENNNMVMSHVRVDRSTSSARVIPVDRSTSERVIPVDRSTSSRVIPVDRSTSERVIPVNRSTSSTRVDRSISSTKFTRVGRSTSSARVTPIFDEPIDQFIDIPIDSSDDQIGYSGEHFPMDAWLPITESRNGNIFTATFHLLCSGIGSQALLLPVAFISLGWVWGIICLTAAFLWQFYTTWLLVNLHESSPPPQNGPIIRFSRFLHLSIVAFGPRLGKFLALFPVLYLSGGACTFFVNSGGTTLELLYRVMCDNNSGCLNNTLSGAEWFVVFASAAILLSLCFTSLDSLKVVTFIGSIAVVVSSTLIWILSVTNGRQVGSQVNQGETSSAERFRDVMTGLGIIAIVFRGHNLILEIQGTFPSDPKVPSRKPMWRGVMISYFFVAACLYPLAIVGHWAYGNEVTMIGGVLRPFVRFQQNNNTSKYLIGFTLLMVIINYLCAYQIYAIVTLDNMERVFYVSKKNKPSPRWVRSLIKVVVGGIVYFIAVTFPFLTNLAIFIGSLTVSLTLSYPCFMWLAIKKPQRFSRSWFVNMGLGSSGILLSVVMFIAALWILVVRHFYANFFNPR